MPNASSDTPDTIGVLVCDDSDALRLLLYVIVSGDPSLCMLGEARNGAEAISQAELLQPDVILLDLSMPYLSGMEALPRIKAAAPRTHVIAFTGLSGSTVLNAVLDAGADSFLEKGATADAITDAIKTAHAHAQREAAPSELREAHA